MRSTWMLGVLLCAVPGLVGGVAAEAQTDVALSVYGAFHGTTNGNGTIQSPSNSAGGMIELRHISNPLVGWEATYSYNRDNQVYSSACAGVTCTSVAPQPVSANAHEISGDWVASVHIANLRPFALAGVGLLFNQPTGGQVEHNQRDQAGVPVRRGTRLGRVSAHRIAVSVSRKSLQGSGPDAALHVDERIHAYIGADDRGVSAVLAFFESRP